MNNPKTEIVYQFILSFKAQYDGNSPTIREIAGGCGISSTSMVEYYLDKLVKDGRIILTKASGSRKMLVRDGCWTIIGIDGGD